jgi:hypothetical protein
MSELELGMKLAVWIGAVILVLAVLGTGLMARSQHQKKTDRFLMRVENGQIKQCLNLYTMEPVPVKVLTGDWSIR